MRSTATIIVALILTAGLARPGRADDAPAPKCETPRGCIEAMHGAAQKSDFPAMCAHMSEPARSKLLPMLLGSTDMENASNELGKAMDAKFGAGSAEAAGIRQRPSRKDMKMEILEVKEEGDKATVKTRDTRPDGKPGKEETFDLARVDGSWQVSIPASHPKMGEQAWKMSESMAPAMKGAATELQELSAGVTSGTVATKEEAAQKFRAIQMKLGAAAMAAGAGPRLKPPPTPPAPPAGEEKKPAEGGK